MPETAIRTCPKGHPMTPDNLRGGKRLAAGIHECLTCHREREKGRSRRSGIPSRTNWIEQGVCSAGHPATPDNIRYNKGKPECATCHREKQIARYHADPETHKRKASDWKKRNRKSAAEGEARWRREHIEHHRAYMRQQQRWRRLGKDSAALEYATVLLNDPCSYCGERAGTIDHIVPIIAGGSNKAENLTAACHGCNTQKNAKPALIFMAKRAA